MAQPFGMGNVDMNYYGPLQGGAGGPFGIQGGPLQGGMQFPQFFGGYDVKTQGGTRPGSFQNNMVGGPKPSAFRTMDFQDTNMNGIDDRDEQNFSGPSQEYLDQLERTRQAFNPGQANVNQPTGPAPLSPVLQQQDVQEIITDPLIRSLYFGTETTPGFYDQLQQAAGQALQQQVPLQQTAGISPLEQAAIQQAYGGIGAFEPYLQAQEQSLQEAVAAERRAGEQMQPYFAQAEQQLGAGLGGLMGSLGRMGPSARDFQRASLVGFDPRSSQAFFNPFEQQVVQRTLDDAFQASEMQDIQQRARDIQAGGESAFGSRARLSAEERRRSLGRGLGEALAGIRQGGFENAMQRAQTESQFQRGALERAAGFERGLGSDELAARRGFAQDILGLGGQRAQLTRGIGSALAGYGQQFGGLGRERQDLGARQRAELMQLGAVPRNILETQYGRQFAQQLAQQQRPLGILGQVGQMLPRYTGSQTRIGSAYGIPADPVAGGIGAGLSIYGGALNPNAYRGQQQQQ